MKETQILAVVVIYNESLYATQTYRSFLKNELNNNLLKIFVYDNSPIPLHSQNEFSEKIVYWQDTHNSGLSKAYNIAGEYALKHNYQWLLLLDQDTDLSKIAINDYLSSIACNKEIYLHVPRVKLIDSDKYLSPTKKRFKMSRPSSFVCSGINLISDYAIINSGMLINIDTFCRAGGYNEKVWLDYSDYDFLERYSIIDKYFAVVPKTCVQNFSDAERDVVKIQKRFSVFIECVNACRKKNIYDRLCFELILLKRMLNLSFRTQSFIPFQIYMKQHFWVGIHE